MSDFIQKDEKANATDGQAKNSTKPSKLPLSKKTEAEMQILANISKSIGDDNDTNTMGEATLATFNSAAGVWFNKFNREFKDSQTVKLLVYGVQKNNVMIRVSNLEDRFDGLSAQAIQFDVNAWAREFYIEANSHFLAKNTTSQIIRGIRLQIQEMNLVGSVPKSMF